MTYLKRESLSWTLHFKSQFGLRIHMPNLLEAKAEEALEFCWGHKKIGGGPNNDVQFYDSFTYDGTKYCLYDCVYMWDHAQPEPHIGKLVKIWETASNKKKVKVVWFFRPIEIKHWLGDIKPLQLQREIFLASGEGRGLFNLNPLEAISGKCNVVCASNDSRNTQLAEEDLRKADYIFFRTFDVGSCKISTKFANKVAGVEVKHYFNLRKVQNASLDTEHKANLKAKTETFEPFPASGVANAVQVVRDGQSAQTPSKDSKVSPASWDEQANSCVQEGIRSPSIVYGTSARVKMKISEFSSTDMPETLILKRRKLQYSSDEATGAKPLSRSSGYKEKFVNVKDPFSEKRSLPKRINISGKDSKGSHQFRQDNCMKSNSQTMEVTRRLKMDSSKWFNLRSWEDKINAAHEKGTLVLLNNLDPSYTSTEVEEIVLRAFDEQVIAKMIQHSTFSSPNYGQAFVICKSKGAADSVIYELNRRCLMLGDGRPVVGRGGKVGDFHNPEKFFGHLSLPKARLQKQHEDMRNAVSTSHYSQSNTVEYDMAMEWCGLYERSKLRWEALHKAQAKEVEGLRNRIKVHHQQ